MSEFSVSKDMKKKKKKKGHLLAYLLTLIAKELKFNV